MDGGLKKAQNPSPKITANPVSLLTFWWLIDIFKLGFKKDLEIEDLYDALHEHQSGFLGDKLETLWNKELQRANSYHREPSLIRVLIRMFGLKAASIVLSIASAEFVFQIAQPIFLGGLIDYFSPGSNISHSMAYLYAVGVIVCSFFNIIIKNPTWLAALHTGMKLRVAVCSLVYRKALRLSKTALGSTTVGQSVNILSNDVARFDRTFVLSSYLLVGPVQTFVIVYLLWSKIGISAFVGVAAVLLFIPAQGGFGKMISVFRMRTAKKTDERIRFMNEIIVGIQVIKMYAWEKPFAHLVSIARRIEVKYVRASCFLRGLLLSFARFGTKVAVFITIVTYVLSGERLTAEKVFVVAAYFNIMKQSMTEFVPIAVADLAESCVSMKRVQAFLLNDEAAVGVCDTVKQQNGGGKTGVKKGIKLNKVSAMWTRDLPDNTLSDVDLEVQPKQLVAIIGPVGSGKTSLLHAILKELPLSSGSISVGGSVSYASQEPWLFTGSVRQNILFGQPMNRDRYRRVIKACALETDFLLFPHGDKTIVGERGVTLSGGQRARINLARAVYKRADVYLLDDPLSAVDTHVGRHLFEDCICGFLQDKTRVLVTHQLQYLQAADNIVILQNGAIEAVGTYNKLQSSGLDFAKQLGLEAKEEDNTVTNNKETSSYGSEGSLNSRNRKISECSQVSSVAGSEPVVATELRTHGKVRAHVYWSYLSAGGNCCIVLLVFGLSVLGQLAFSGADYWLSYWSNVEEHRLNTSYVQQAESWQPSTEFCIYVFSGIVLSLIILAICNVLCLFTLCMRASIRLHSTMFENIVHATMHFFNTNPSGQILNRFSKDMGTVDEILPPTLVDCVQIGLSLVGVVTIVAVVNPWLLIPSALMFSVFYVLRLYIIATSRSVKRLEGVTRSPVFSHLSASLQGLTTIRALGAEAVLKEQFDSHQDLHSSAHYMYLVTGRAFAVWLDSTCLMFITLVTLSFLVLSGDSQGGDVGLAITQAIGLTGLIQWGIRQSAELENQMTAVERVLEYTTVEKESICKTSENAVIKPDWPAEVAIVFDHVYLSYVKDEPSVLRDINFSLKPAEKVGIVGRTGAGKSSLITALFRLVEISDGCIRIDGVDTSTIGLHDLRSKISIIPQEPALFSGPLRDNLDPFSEYSDAVLWSALAEVELKQAVEELPAGLSHKVSEGGSNFSVGQRQLLCLARAIIRNNKILVLDEATANVDPQTDELIQKTIRSKFAECTVITIAHRLHTVIDSNRIMVLEAGSIVEFDHPHVLLQKENGVLYHMVQQTGTAAESLFKAAQLSYERTKGQWI